RPTRFTPPIRRVPGEAARPTRPGGLAARRPFPLPEDASRVMLLVPDPHARLAAVELRGRFVDGEGRPLPSHGVDYAVGGTERLRPLLRELRAALGPLAVESARAECHPGQYE